MTLPGGALAWCAGKLGADVAAALADVARVDVKSFNNSSFSALRAKQKSEILL